MNLNKVFIIGRLTADPQLKTTPNGQSVATFSIATNRVWNDKNGAKQEETEFHNIVVWGRQAEVAGKFLMKGSETIIEGRIKTRTWQDKEGQNRRTTEIICEALQLGARPGNIGGGWQGGSNTASSRPPAPKEESSNDNQVAKVEELPTIDMDDTPPAGINDDDLPF